MGKQASFSVLWLFIILTLFAAPTRGASLSHQAGLEDSPATTPGPSQGQPVAGSGIADLRISEIMYDPIGGNDFEFIELYNAGSTVVTMAGVAFTVGIAFTFPAGFNLPAHQHAVLVNDPAAFALRYPSVTVAGQYTGQLDNGGEEVVLSAVGGATLLDFAYDDEAPWPTPAGGDGYSLVIVNPNGNPGQAANWRASTFPNGSPGQDDPPALPGTVVINEILANSNLPFEDAIELYNPGSQAVALGGWFLSDSPTTLNKYRIPDGTSIAPGGYSVFYEYQFNANPGVPPSFGLSALGDQVYLASADSGGALTGYTTAVSFGASEQNVSFGRHLASVGVQFVPMARPTFGVDAPATVEQFRTGSGAANAGPRVGPVVINELMYNPSAGGDEFVELLNITGGAVQLFDPSNPADAWRFTTGISYTLPANTTLAANAYALVVGIDPAAFRATYQIPQSVPVFGPYAGALSNSGERVELSRPANGAAADIAADTVAYADVTPWPTGPDGNGPSLERIRAWEYGNDPINWAASSAAGGSPGRRNSVSPNVTPTWTPTRTPTPTPSPTLTATPTGTPSPTPTPSPTSSTTETATATVTATTSPPSLRLYLPTIVRS